MVNPQWVTVQPVASIQGHWCTVKGSNSATELQCSRMHTIAASVATTVCKMHESV